MTPLEGVMKLTKSERMELQRRANAETVKPIRLDTPV